MHKPNEVFYLAEVWLNVPGVERTEIRRFADPDVARAWASERINEPDTIRRAEVSMVHPRSQQTELIFSIKE